MLFAILLIFVQGGRIYPKTSRPILLSRNNAESLSSYTFFYQISSYIPSDSLLEVTFPSSVYPSGLSLTTCQATNWDSQLLPCTVSSYTVSVSVGELSNANSNNTYNLTIHNIKNPSKGGSSLFRLQLRRGVNILDYNDFFSDIGIVPALSPIDTYSVTCFSNCIAGQTAIYNLTYKTTQKYELNTRIFIYFPSTLTLNSDFSCESSEIPDIECKFKQNTVSFTILAQEISSASELNIGFKNILNPQVSGNVGDFGITVFTPVVNTVIEEINQIPGPDLDPNSIKSIVACPGGDPSICIGYYPYTALSNTQPYTLRLQTTNGVPLGGSIQIKFIPGFTLRENYCLVLSGLKNQGYTEDDQILCSVSTSTSTLTITRFKSFKGGEIALQVIATNPASSGRYSSFQATTYTASSVKIDTGSAGYIDVQDLPHPLKWQVSFNKPLVVNSKVQMTVIFQPDTSGLKSNDVSFNFHLPSSFAFTGTVLGYLTPHDVFPELTVTPTISGSSVSIPSSSQANSYTNSLNSDNRLRLAGSSATDGILLPALPGKYFIEMIVVNTGDDIEAILQEVEVLADVMPGSVQSFSYDVNRAALYEVKFTPTITIPQGKVPELPTYSWGTFDIRFPSMNSDLQALWKTDLATGSEDLAVVPCRAIKNIKPVDGDNLNCRLIRAGQVDPSTYATVRVTNFQIIYKNVPVTIHIANVSNPQTEDISVAVTVVSYSITQRIYQEYNKVNFTYPRYFYLNSNPKLPKINGRSPKPYGDGLNEIKFSPNTVGLYSQSSFIVWTESDHLSGGHFYLKFPTTYPLNYEDIRCFLNYATELDCYTYPDSGWISILNLAFDLENHVEYTMTIRYLRNPSHREEPASASMVGISDGVEIEYFYFTAFKYLDLGAVYPVNVYPSSYKANNVDSTYYFIFTLTNDLPLGSSIVLSFPKKDYVLDTYPAPQCEISKALEPVDELEGISCNISGTSVVMSGFQKYVGGNTITVEVFNILNPATMRITDYFEIESYDGEGKLVDGNYIIDKISIESEENVGLFEYVDFYANPSNGLAVADYTVSILPSRNIPNGSIIKIIFPSNEFSDIQEDVSCELVGGLSTLETCFGDGVNIVQVVTDEDYFKDSLSLPINVTIFGITNFGPKLTSGLLEVEISNTGIVIDATPDSEDHRKVVMGDQPGDLTLQSLQFSPKTSGEKAVYNFSFIASTSFDKTCQIIIKFPQSFSRDLSEQVSCFSQNISKNPDFSVKCVVKGRILTIYDTLGFDSKSQGFDLSIQHVRNPVNDIDGQFVFFTQCGYEMQDFGKSDFKEAFSQIPDPAYLISSYSKGSTTLYSQELIKLGLESLDLFTTSSEDQVFIEFPEDYNLYFVQSMIECSTYISNQEEKTSCSYEPNRIKLSSFPSTPLSTSNLTVGVQNIENPAKQQQAQYITLSYFSYSSSTVQVKTYPNLNRVDPFSYSKHGIEVIVNNLNSFSINQQTTFDSIQIKIPSGAQTSFSVKGFISEKSCSISPNPIVFHMRDFIQSFSVSCTSSSIIGDHYINWYFLGDWPANYWSPIQRTYFSVVSSNQDTISVQEIGAVSLGGQSLPILITLSHSPEAFINISLSQIGTLPTGVTIFPNVTSFVSGELVKSFRVQVESSAIGLTGKVLIKKYGKNAGVYVLSPSVLSFDIGAKDDRFPVVVEYKDLVISRVFASFSITLDEACNIYWMVGRYGTRSPTLEEAKNAKLENVDGLVDSPKFGYLFDYNQLQQNRFQYTIQVRGLLAQTNYTIHILAVDIGGNRAKYTPIITFTTLDRYRSAQFQLYFNKTLSAKEEAKALKKVADVLDIAEDMVVKRTDFSGSTGSADSTRPDETSDYTSSSGLGRSLATVYTLVGLVLPDPSLDIKPLDLANSLNDHKAELSQLVGFNSTSKIIGQEVYGTKPVLRARPRVGSLVSGKMTIINLALFEPGFISVCVVVYNESRFNPPVPYQINNQLDTDNYKCNLSQVIQANPVPVQVLFEGIEKNLEYRVMVSAFNTLQGFPDYMWDVFVISFTTFGMADQGNDGLAGALCALAWTFTLFLI